MNRATARQIGIFWMGEGSFRSLGERRVTRTHSLLGKVNAMAIRLKLLFPAALLSLLATAVVTDSACAAPSALSTYAEQASSHGGIGKLYMGREIAQVMGHRGASWLERPSRVYEERPDELVAHMDLAPNHVVADLGAGTGYFTFRISPRVPEGRVYAVDIQPEMLEIIRTRIARRHIRNVTPVLGTATDPRLTPNSIDAVLLVDTYHEFSHPYEIMTAVVKALKPGGRVFLAEYRAEDRTIPIKRLHKMSEAQARMEMEAVGLHWMGTLESLPSQHLMIFEKPNSSPVMPGPELPPESDHTSGL